HLAGEPGPAAHQAAASDDARAHAQVTGEIHEVVDAATGQAGRLGEGGELRVVLQRERRVVGAASGFELLPERHALPAEVRGEADGRALVVDGAGGGDGDARDPQPLRLRLGEHGPDLRGGEVEDGVERVGAAVVTVGPGHRDGGGGADGAAEV